jgi:hypothetical protein
MGDIGWIIKLSVGVAVVALILATIVALWPVWLGLAVIGIPSFIYWKSQKRKQNMV